MAADNDKHLDKASGDAPANFVREIISADVASGKHDGRVHTRFPPEPSGYLHIGHAKSLCLNFGMAKEFGGLCNLRFDDTNPSKEDVEFVDSIQEDVRWLGFDWDDRLFFASDYFERLYELAVKLIEDGKAYVCSLSEGEIREFRGNFYHKGKDSPYCERSIADNLDLFARMRAGEFDDGSQVLRAKIDMQSTNLNMRDPIIYRIRRAHHHHTGDQWCIYPMYDYAHCISDALEGITHSVCTLEFEDHRPLYDWFLDQLDIGHPQQIEFARLNLSYTVLSKRLMIQLADEGYVDGWDDPRMPSLAGMRRRGYTAHSVRRLCDRVGVAKKDGVVDVALLEHAIREELNQTSPRVMAVLRPLKVVIDNFPEDEVIDFDAAYFPDEPERGTRKTPFSKVIYIERDDFREDPPKKWFRLAPGREIRLRYACLITCVDVIKDDAGEVVELHCTWDPESRGGNAPDGRRVRGTSHWVSAAHAIDAEVRLYDRLFKVENPLDVDEGQDFKSHINPESREVLTGCKLEPSLAESEAGARVQFERLGYFCVDSRDSRPGALVFNRTISLRDGWAKIEKAARADKARAKKAAHKQAQREKQAENAKKQAENAKKQAQNKPTE